MRNMRIVKRFKCEMTGDQCVVVRDHAGDELCMLIEDYNAIYKPTKELV